MKITLLHYTPLDICSTAIRTCWQSFKYSDDGGDKDKDLISRVGNKFKHKSTLEHLHYSFNIEGISRACLQELARHRMASLSVKSTRYTLRELEREDKFGLDDKQRASKYVVFTDIKEVDEAIISTLNKLKDILQNGISNDKAKFALIEAYKSDLVWSVNARSLQNFLELRTSKSALWEIRDLAHNIFKALPQEHIYIFKEFVSKTT